MGHQDHREMWALRVLPGVKEEKGRLVSLEREDQWAQKDSQVCQEIRVLLAFQENAESLGHKELRVKWDLKGLLEQQEL